MMASNWSLCGVCVNRQITKSSIVWCSDCEEGLCGNCKEHHSIAKETKSHETVSITEYEKLPTKGLQIDPVCKLHHEKYELFCKKHDCPCCKKCVKSHNDCRGLTDINEIIKHVKTSSAFCEIEQTLMEVTENIKRLSTNRKENLKTLKDQKKEIEAEINQMRTKINRHLDKLQDDFIKELMAVEQKESIKIKKNLNYSQKRRKKRSLKYKKTLLVLNRMRPNFKLFNHERYRKDIAVGENFIESEITASVQEFGEINVSSDPCDFTIQKRKDRQAQIMVALSTRNIDNLTVTLQKRIKTELSDVRGCAQLPGECKEISIVDLNNHKLKKSLAVNSFNHGVVYKDEHLIYCAREKGLQMISINDDSITNVTNSNLPYYAYVTTFGDKLFYTKFDNDSVTCCDYKGNTIWTFRDISVLSAPLGISVDNDGCVYVVGFDSNNVVVISPDVQRCRQFLSREDGLSGPQVLHYDQSTNQLIVANRANHAFLFDVKC
ncbi:unnamed protein product [Mytilus edulis]|uniref:B box-type domain-containing protein n=1 Tax=Mytilus edulis TaxID=6550 RepID=A0A8S3UJQ4_MYTED|nr:unnamed protein product [Mytilus edulis]